MAKKTKAKPKPKPKARVGAVKVQDGKAWVCITDGPRRGCGGGATVRRR